ncbi:hypothetical protein GCM10020220_085930 [Nonomuraea rubra]
MERRVVYREQGASFHFRLRLGGSSLTPSSCHPPAYWRQADSGLDARSAGRDYPSRPSALILGARYVIVEFEKSDPVPAMGDRFLAARHSGRVVPGEWTRRAH